MKKLCVKIRNGRRASLTITVGDDCVTVDITILDDAVDRRLRE